MAKDEDFDIGFAITVAIGALLLCFLLYLPILLVEYVVNKIVNCFKKVEPATSFDLCGYQLRHLLNRRLELFDDVNCELWSYPAARPKNIINLNALLSDIHKRYIALKREDFELHYRVFSQFFGELHRNMKQVDKYYQRYSSDVKFAGSHFDSLRIKKPDEFDMDIVIGVPVNMSVDRFRPAESDIIIEQNYPGFVQLRAGVQYQNLLIRDGPDCVINKTAYSWLDDKKYILRSKFISWFKSVGYRALNKFQKFNRVPMCCVDGVDYAINTSESGPAWTIILLAPGFRLDVDLVPALKFPESRWPVGQNYRPIPDYCRRGYWMVVPKPNKDGNSIHDEHRSWRIALQDQEKQLLYNTFALRQTIRLIKKLRDTLGMFKIASYYIKTIFYWNIMAMRVNDREFWIRNDIGTLFKYMVRKLHESLDKKRIPYFWNGNHNLIGHVPDSILEAYQRKLLDLLTNLEHPSDYKEVARFLLTPAEYEEYRPALHASVPWF